jgi:hypothetical protein
MTKQTSAKQAKAKAPVSLRPRADGTDEAMVLTAPSLGTSGVVRVRKAMHDALAQAVRVPHVSRISVPFGQGTDGVRAAYVRLIIDEDFPVAPAETLQVQLRAMADAAADACRGVLGVDFAVFVDFGGKRLR